MKVLTYKKKCYLLFGGVLLFLVVGYHVSFLDTFILKDEIITKKKKLEWLKAKEKELPFLKAQMEEFERVYSGKDSTSVRQKLTTYISEYAEKNNCLVTEIPLNSFYKNKNLKVQTNVFTIRGSFNHLISLLNLLENEYKYVSKIMSGKFYSVRDMQTKKANLYLTIITQSFEQKHD